MELVKLGSSEIDEASGVIWARCVGAEVDSSGAAPDYGKVVMMQALGFAHRPAPADDEGSAEGVAVDGLGGLDGVAIAAHDPRAAKVYGEIEPGEGAMFATGKGYDSRALAKKQLFAIIVGDDYIVTVDRLKKKIAISCPGGIIQVSEKDGVTLCDSSGKGALRLDGGVASLLGQCILGGSKPQAKLAREDMVRAEFIKLWTAVLTLTNSGGPVATPNPFIPSASLGANGVFCGG